jgi:hypothetical protein
VLFVHKGHGGVRLLAGRAYEQLKAGDRGDGDDGEQPARGDGDY